MRRILLILLMIFSGCGKKKEYEYYWLKYRMEKGEKYMVQYEQREAFVQKVEGRGIRSRVRRETEVGIQLKLEVIEVEEDEDVRFKCCYQNVKIKQEGPFGNFVFDNAPQDSSNIFSLLWKAIMESELEVTISPDGKIKEVWGVNEVTHKVLEEIKRNTSLMVDTLFLKFLVAENIEGMMRMIWNIYSEDPIKVGGKWEKDNIFLLGLPVRVRKYCTLKEVDEDKGIIEVYSLLLPLPEFQALVRYDVSGYLRGRMRVNMDTGVLESYEAEGPFSGSVEAGEGQRVRIVFQGKKRIRVSMKRVM